MAAAPAVRMNSSMLLSCRIAFGSPLSLSNFYFTIVLLHYSDCSLIYSV